MWHFMIGLKFLPPTPMHNVFHHQQIITFEFLFYFISKKNYYLKELKKKKKLENSIKISI